MAITHSRSMSYVVCSADGTILCTEERRQGLDVGSAIVEDVSRLPAKAGSYYITKIGENVIKIFRVECASFSGYVGIVYASGVRDEIIDGLGEAKTELEAIFESSHDGIVVADGGGVFIRINSNYERITGNRKEDIIGQTAQSIIDKGYVSDSVTLHVLQDAKPHTFAQTFRSGRESVITGSPIFDDRGNLTRVVTNVRDMTEINRLREELAESRKKLNHYSQMVESLRSAQMTEDMLVFRSRQMWTVRDCALKFAKVDAPLLITGESGVGKEVIADFVYRNSPRKGHPFLKINCGAIPENLLESELFGYEGGAFTGARREGQLGLFELANGGTLMLDEIGELSLALQVKLLRVVQNNEFYRVGGNNVINVDVRLIAATNRDLQEMVASKQFRSDLFFRLNVLKIAVPPLRDRKEDIIPLANFMLAKYNNKYRVSKRFSAELFQLFVNYTWSGNVRELENLIEHLVVISDRNEITPEYLPDEMRDVFLERREKEEIREKRYKEAMEEFEREFLSRAIAKYKSSRQTARTLGLDHSTVVKKAAKYGLHLLPRWPDDLTS